MSASTKFKNGIRSLVERLDKDLDNAYKQLRVIEGYEFDSIYNRKDQDFPIDFEYKKFASQLIDIYRLTAFSLEVAELCESRLEFIRGWQNYTSNLIATEWIHEVDVLHSEPLAYLSTFIEGLRLLILGIESPIAIYEKERLENMLESTAVLVRKRCISPTRESEIKKIMEDYLSAAFVDFIKTPVITGFIKNFKPDGGVKGIKAAIEYKFVETENDLKTAVSGILEDTSGYRGSEDWKLFYSVIYMTEPFEATSRIKQELRRASIKNWKVFLVNEGKGKQKKSKNQKAKAK